MGQARPYSGIFCGGVAVRTLAGADQEDHEAVCGASGGGGAWMISWEAPVVFSKACELFIAELTRCAWAAALEGKRRTVHKEDVTAAVQNTDLFDFLVDVVMADAGHAPGCDGGGTLD